QPLCQFHEGPLVWPQLPEQAALAVTQALLPLPRGSIMPGRARLSHLPGQFIFLLFDATTDARTFEDRRLHLYYHLRALRVHGLVRSRVGSQGHTLTVAHRSLRVLLADPCSVHRIGAVAPLYYSFGHLVIVSSWRCRAAAERTYKHMAHGRAA